MRKVLIATPSIDGKVDIQYTNSLVSSLIECSKQDIILMPVFVGYDALIQRARNDLFKIAYESDVDDVVFIDADMTWTPNQLLQLLSHQVDVVGGTARRKSFNEEYVIRVLPGETKINVKDKLVEVSGLGTGFLKLSKKVIKEVYESCQEYKQGTIKSKMVFDIKINEEDGELLSEDIVLSEKIRNLGYSIYLDPYITCGHIGTISFYGDLIKWANVNNLIDFKD